ncbi:MAG: guanylate kinase [Candidatus Marinimicrobia bacterium]|nr:guanylate kinase [Candidatus Neomarinimicrobiota bacterium]
MSKHSIKGLLVIFAAHSGAGKTTIIKQLLQKNKSWKFSISATTRKKRDYEKNGKDYYFISSDKFNKLLSLNELVESENVHGEYYGTIKEQVTNTINNGQILILDLDVLGALNVKRQFPNNSITIFIDVPNEDLLIQRLKKRATESKESIEKRLSRISLEKKEKDNFDFIVINDKLTSCINKIEKIIKNNILKLGE